MVSLSRWLVGSSRMSRSQGAARTEAMASRFCCPPDRRAAEASISFSPSRPSIARHSYSAVSCRKAAACFIACTRTVQSSSKCGDCGRYPIRNPETAVTVPSSAESSPAIIFNKVDFPVPFTPITPIFSPLFMEKETPSSRRRSV